MGKDSNEAELQKEIRELTMEAGYRAAILDIHNMGHDAWKLALSTNPNFVQDRIKSLIENRRELLRTNGT